MAFDYNAMADVAYTLLSDQMFGNPFILRQSGKSIYDPKTKKTVPSFNDYTGMCVMKAYSAEQIGTLSNILKAGDVEFICVMDDEKVVPEEGKSKVIFNDVTYNVISTTTINPNGQKVLIYKLQSRRAM